MRVKFVVFTLLSAIATLLFAENVNQCCILMDVIENGKTIENEYEMWDFSIDTDRNYFDLNVSSFILMDNSMGMKPKCYYLYNWHHEAKSIIDKGNKKYEIITDGRISNYEMRIIVIIGNHNRVESLTAYLPIGDNDKQIRQFKINQKKETIEVAPLYNSAFIVKSK